MTGSFALMKQRRFLPLFATQFLNAFNDNFYKMAMVILVTFTIYKDPETEAWFNALAGGLFILPFFLFSALAGQLADSTDKTRMIRLIKTAEIFIMIVGAIGIWLHLVPVMLLALFAMGTHSTFFGPIKYAILPQHLEEDEVLAGTGWVEAGTYIAILGGTIVGGLTPPHIAIPGIIIVAVIGRLTANYVPAAPPEAEAEGLVIDHNVFRSSWRLVNSTMHIPRLFLAIVSISFFWAIGAILAAQFPPLVKNALGADNTVATLFTAIFSVGVAVGSIIVNRLLKGHVSARYSPGSVIVMGLFVLDLWWNVKGWAHAGYLTNWREFLSMAGADRTVLALFKTDFWWSANLWSIDVFHDTGDNLMNWRDFLALTTGDRIILDLLGIAIAGGMFVVPLYAFLTTTVAKSQTARTVAANNIVNSGFMVAATLLLSVLIGIGLTIDDTLLMVAAMCLVSSVLAWKLHKACD
ncbi:MULTISPECIES: MFS transporter [unclassified Sphingopyxis]|uniref:MFS transporter n=1 Tax=unclassified Sphingopyxis TaxID=2614943 RepID=UPI00285DB549|nr:MULTISPECIES: MFS transporter [unclassified Sphingopyxis]MDR6831830.1 MFS family permease [Sphingopyxis sp. BE122]MDR7227572.1 MFS family permease [Sphingopyxis sp. BE259]